MSNYRDKRALLTTGLLFVLTAVGLTGCLASRMQSRQSGGADSFATRFDPAKRLSPTAFEQNVTMSDTSVREDPDLLKVGVSQEAIVAAFVAPNEINHQGSQEQDLYEFNPDGTKFVKPQVYPTEYGSRSFHCRNRYGSTPGTHPLYRPAA